MVFVYRNARPFITTTTIGQLTKSGEIGVDSVLCQFAVEQLESMSDTDSTILVRIMSLSARMSCVSEYAFAACLRSGFLTKALMTLKQTEDILLQMSAFEVVVEVKFFFSCT